MLRVRLDGTLNVLIDVLENALCPMVVQASESVSVFKLLQLVNADVPMDVALDRFTDSNDVHFLNAIFPIVVTFSRLMDFSAEHSWKALFSMLVTVDGSLISSVALPIPPTKVVNFVSEMSYVFIAVQYSLVLPAVTTEVPYDQDAEMLGFVSKGASTLKYSIPLKSNTYMTVALLGMVNDFSVV
jgi:hypothetical protein